MKVSKLFFATILALCFGLGSCSNDDDVTSSSQEEGKGNTHVSVSLNLSQNSGLRSASELPKEWVGNDDIKDITIYLVDATSVVSKTFTVGVEYKLNDAGILVPNNVDAAIQTTPGIKKVYVLVNDNASIKDKLITTSPQAFETAYNTAVDKTAKDIATKTETTPKKEVIFMSNASDASCTVFPNITKEQAIKTENIAKVNVERAVARVMVTKSDESYPVYYNSKKEKENDTDPDPVVMGTISDITWSVAQGEKSFYIQRKSDWATPNFGWVPNTNDELYSQATDKYDYSGLSDDALVLEMDKSNEASVTSILNHDSSSKFILPTTHKSGEGVASHYKKGNTAYILVRAKLTPVKEAFGDTEGLGGQYTTGNDLFLGANGKFYISKENAQDATKGGVLNQKVTTYVGGKVLYYAWLKPDDIAKPYNSEVKRNNIYHVHITGFKTIGVNWNPLYPGETGNPDPLPDGEDGTINPIKPTDPLTTPETWMSVEVTVLQWKVNSYEVELGI